jgi:hypothetical protein
MTVKAAKVDGDWAFIGPGNQQAPDSWLILQAADPGSSGFKCVVFSLQSKKRTSPDAVNEQQLQEEAEKVLSLSDDCKAAQVSHPRW